MIVLRRFMRDIPAVLGLFILLSILFCAVFAWVIVPSPDGVFESDILNRLQPPSYEHPFGTDDLGRDVLSRVIVGSQSALAIGVGVVLLALVIGVPLGLWTGYMPGPLSQFIMRFTDVFLAVPQLVLALAVSQILWRGLESAAIALALTYWPFIVRTVFAEVQRQKVMLYIEALEGLGASRWRIMVMHLLPNVAPAIIIRATIGIGFIILTAATLGFLGIGATPPSPDWGLSIAESRRFLPESWWLALFPGIAILLTVLGFNLVGDGLRDILDPKLRRSR